MAGYIGTRPPQTNVGVFTPNQQYNLRRRGLWIPIVDIFEDDFTASSLDTTLWNIGGDAVFNGTDDRVELTTNSGSQLGLLDAGNKLDGISKWTLTLDWRLQGDVGADLTNFIFYHDGLYDDGTGGGGSAGFDNGYYIEINYDNGTVKLKERRSASSSTLASGTYDTAWDGQVNDVEIIYDSGSVTLSVNGSQVLSHTVSSPDESINGIGFSAGTGGSTALSAIDFVKLVNDI